MKTSLSIQQLKRVFDHKIVHEEVSFDLQENEMLGLFGGSGSGKSLILRSIIGLEKPDHGKIWFENKNLCALTEQELLPIRIQIGFVFQNGALFDSLTVEENIAYPLHEHTKLSAKKIRERVNEMLELVDMKNTNKLLPNELSGGMQKRAGLARATILGPKIILFDEPTAGLDPQNTKRLIDNILKLKERGVTGIFVSHDVPAALALCDRIAILSKGKIAVMEDVQEIQKSSNPLVRSFLYPLDQTQPISER